MTETLLWPWYATPAGGLAGAGLLLLLAGAVSVHVRKGEGAHALAPAVLCAVLVGGYLAALYRVTP